MTTEQHIAACRAPVRNSSPDHWWQAEASRKALLVRAAALEVLVRRGSRCGPDVRGELARIREVLR